jgi:hypothetical protein
MYVADRDKYDDENQGRRESRKKEIVIKKPTGRDPTPGPTSSSSSISGNERR